MKKTKSYILRVALLVLVCILAWQTPVLAVVHQGTIGVAVSSESLLLLPGQSENVSVTFTPSSSDQLECCDKPDCPESCTKWTMMGATCLDENGQCTCLGTTYQTYYASADVSSSDTGVATASYDGSSTITISAVSPGTATITVTASLRQFTSSSVTIMVTVAQSEKVTGSDTDNDGDEAEDRDSDTPDETVPPVIPPYTDVDSGDWYYDPVAYMYGSGIMTGVTESTFDPDGLVTRAMAVTTLYRIAGQPQVEDSSSFTDLTQDWYKNAVTWAEAAGVTRGVTETTFAPDTVISREQLVTMLYRFAEYAGVDVSVGERADLSGYADADAVSAYALPAMRWACGAGIIQGAGENDLQPAASGSRAVLATVLMRYCESIAE